MNVQINLYNIISLCKKNIKLYSHFLYVYERFLKNIDLNAEKDFRNT